MRYFDYSPMYYHASFWPSGLLSLLLNVLVWGIVIYLFIMLVKRISHGEHDHCCSHEGHDEGHSDTGNSYYLHIVKERFAKGDIDRKQFEELKKGLLEDDEPPMVAKE